MSKKYEISTEAQVLLRLLRIALGTEPMAEDGKLSEQFPENTDWREVIRLSYEQKVSALAVDGLKASGYDPREGKSGCQLEELNAVLTPWFDDVKNTEESYAYYFTVLSTLCQIFSANGLKPVILKGYGLSQNYPIPSHRGVGDIDIYLIDKTGNPASEQGLDIIRKLTNSDVELKCHHYEFTFKGITVELHNEITNAISKSKQEEQFRYEIKKKMAENITQCDGYEVPSPTLNAVLQIRHIFTHFFWKGMNLRQLVDWHCFLKTHSNEIEWTVVTSMLNKVNLLPLFNTINSFEIQQLNLNKNLIPSNAVDDKYLKEFNHSLFECNWVKPTGLAKIATYYINRYNIMLLSGEHWIYPTYRSIIRHLHHTNQNPIFKDRID